ncbi:hypothetical protein [Kribbella sp. DT2]
MAGWRSGVRRTARGRVVLGTRWTMVCGQPLEVGVLRQAASCER